MWNKSMRLSACITTRNRTKELDACLRALWNSTVKPHSVTVSDDSQDREVQQQNCQIVEQYPGTTYLVGPQVGVCANRNNAVNAIPKSETDLIAFVDDDIFIEPDFIALAVERYDKVSLEEKNRIILSGISQEADGNDLLHGKLTFRGYFTSSNVPETVAIHAAVFPRIFFEQEQWDENIFFGYEDAELCLRALKRGYQIVHCPELKVINSCFHKGTLTTASLEQMTDYEVYIEAARLYVGIKRYKVLFPNFFKLGSFISIYFAHMTIYLLRRRSLAVLPEIIRRSHIGRLWQPSYHSKLVSLL
jgi:GT2 family glycosyltransferase